MDPSDWQALLGRTADEVRAALDRFDRWEASGERDGQYGLDLVADAAALGVLGEAGVPVFSEESALTEGDRGSGGPVVVVDPVDGSTNASQRIPYYCTSLCVIDDDGPLVALVENLVNGERFEAVRGKGAFVDGRAMSVSSCEVMSEAIVGTSGWPPAPLPSRQFRALGACALDLAAVAAGRLDGFVDPIAGHGVWDYAAGLLLVSEAGGVVAERDGRPLVHLDHSARRGPVAAATPSLRDELLAAIAPRDEPDGTLRGDDSGRRET